MSACRDMREMVLTKSLCGLNEFASELILRYANLDLVFCRKGIDFQRHSRMLHETWTHVVHSDDEYFVDDSMAVFTVPLICLGDETLTSVAVHREILKDLPSCTLSLLDVVATFVMKPARESYAGLTAYIQRKDYVQSRWKTRWQDGNTFLENEVTGERLNNAALEAKWVRYKCRGAYWWLENLPNHKRRGPRKWFWSKEVITGDLHRERFEKTDSCGKKNVFAGTDSHHGLMGN